ncbi:LamG domain-containing protein [Streptomyces sp. PsTaAH-124]|uniref:LamG domain-containing protein n=1 Tax=Streptomyces sp. PsTaAH-124 TaxID=1157638 RepID=UPI00035F9C86|nr:LamG domain-containing protein [Streptomyces sp. PsTaAH-124]
MAALPAPAAHAVSAGGTDSVPLSEGQKALTRAEQSGERVEVPGERTERTTVYANPDGFTFTLEESAVPVRAAAPGGGWRTPDATLEKHADGSVGPKAAVVPMAFSGGGDTAPLARISEQGKSLELGWPGTLPVPRLDGASALYADVLPGVDLRVTATPESFQPVFVVKTPEAAASEKLKKLTFTLGTQGLNVREGAAGNLMAQDADGRTVFKAPPARMWDSTGGTGAPAGPVSSRAVVAAEGRPSGSAKAMPSASSASSGISGSGLEPGQGDTVARMGVDVSSGSLSVTPDADMLTKTAPSAFPLFLDPTVTWGESERTLLRSDGYESYAWGNGDDDEGKGAGKCGTWNGYYCGPGYVQKLYFEFSPDSLKGKKVLDATFRVTEPWAFQCDPRWVDLVRTNNISSATTWSTRPKELDLMVDRNVSAGRGSLCDPDAPKAPIEFHDNSAETNENLTPTVADFAAGKFSRLTLEVRAHDESDTSAWKRFKNDAVLAVKYVALPATPTEVGVVTGSGYVCSTNPASPSVVSDPTPLVQGRPRTAAGGESGASLRIRWRTDVLHGSNWVLAHDDVDGPTTGYVGNLVKQTRTLPTLQEGTQYRLKALTLSYYEDGSNRQNTGYTTPCYFTVDPTAPKAPQVTVGSPYTECTSNDCASHGGPGVKGTFTFKPAAGDANVVAYQYRLSSDAAWSTALTGSTVAAGVTPTRAGTQRLYVRAKDTVGRWGAESVVDFLVAAGEGTVGQWHFAETSGAALDSAAAPGVAHHDAVLSGNATRDDRGRRGLLTHDSAGDPLEEPVTDKGLSLNGSTAYAATSAPVLDTRSSYTVSAWVRVDAGAAHTMTVLGQAPETASPFPKKYTPFGLSYAAGGGDTWSMSVLAADGSLHKAAAQQTTARGVWTHVTGVHDAAAKKISLYLNGKLQATADAGTPWTANGPLQIGRGLWYDNFTDYLQGSTDEVAVWQRALNGDEVAEESRLMTSAQYAGTELVAAWSADQGSGSTVPDTTSGYGRSLTLTGGASSDGESIVLDGVDDAATTAGPVLDDTGSFTATTLVTLDGAALAAKDIGYKGQVLGQRTADGSAWGFWYELTGKQTVVDEETLEEKTVPVGFWRFGRLNADGTFTAVASTESAAVDGMVRLTGVFDAQAGAISLYLGANQSDDEQSFTAKAGSGDFAVGKGFAGGTWQHYLPGRVAEVRMWAGAMADWKQVVETVGD